MEEGDELRRKILGQARAVPRGGGDGQGVGSVERGTAARTVGNGKGKSQRRLQDQEGLQEAG